MTLLVGVLVFLSTLQRVECSWCKPEVGCSGDVPILQVRFGFVVECGDHVDASDAALEPNVTYTQGNLDDDYLLMMLDPDAPPGDHEYHYEDAHDDEEEDEDEGEEGEDREITKCDHYVHWMKEVTWSPGGQLITHGGGDLIPYKGPKPSVNEDAHRYQILLFPRPSGGTLSGVTRPMHMYLHTFLDENKLSFFDLLAKFEFKATPGAKKAF